MFVGCCLAVTLSLVDLIFTALTKDAATSGLQELLLTVLRVGNLFGELLGWACHGWLLTRVTFMSFNHDTLGCEVQLDVIQVLVLVESDLDATSTAAHTFHVVFIERDRDNMTSTGHFLNFDLVNILTQVLKLEIDDTDVTSWLVCVVGCERRLTGDGVVTSEHGLLSGLGLASLDCK